LPFDHHKEVKAMHSFIRIALLCASLAAATAAAQTYPSKPLRLIVPYPAGGSTDQLGRIVAKHISNNLGQPVIVENRVGANTQIGTAEVAKSTPDGHTLLFGGITTFVFNPLMTTKPLYDPKDLAPVSLVARSQLVLVAHPSLQPKSVRELVDLMKANPGKLNYGTAGNGNVLHLATESFLRTTGSSATHVPFSGAAPAMTSLLGGNIDFMFDVISTARPHIQSGKLRAIASTGAQRSPLMPDVPTVAESGYPSYESGTWFALIAPKATPAAVVQRLSNEVAKAVRDPAVIAQLEAMAMEPSNDASPAELNAQIERDLKRWSGLVRDLGIRLD
jgi:tripartite-type tricarboxylate transporter receptor subunit TctC